MSGAARRPKILVVDDDPEIRDLIVAVLQPHGMEIVAAADGPAALLQAACQRFELCVLDVGMPGMNGLEVCRRLRALPFTRALPVLFMTAYQDAKTIDAAFAAGATDYLFKPVNPALLWARVSNLLKMDELLRKADHVREVIELLDVALGPPPGKGPARLG
ncbi:MAG: response regulator [Planctomycetota bacterium]